MTTPTHLKTADPRGELVAMRVATADGSTAVATKRRAQADAQDDRFFVGRNENRPDKLPDDDLLRQLAAAVDANQRDMVFDLAAQLVATRRGQSNSAPSTTMGDADAKLRLPEVASLLTCGTRTVWRLVARKELCPPFHVGGSARWLRREVQEYLDRISKHRR